MDIFSIEGDIGVVVTFVLLVLAIFAFVNCLFYSAASYEAAGKLNKATWALILGLAVLIELFFIGHTGILQLAAIVAPLVYLTDVRPAVSSLRRR